MAVAAMLLLEGLSAPVVLWPGTRKPRTEEFKAQLSINERLGLSAMFEAEDFIPGKCQVVLDAVFGVGFSGPVEGRLRELIEMIEARYAGFTAAVDIPSGIHSDTRKGHGNRAKGRFNSDLRL